MPLKKSGGPYVGLDIGSSFIKVCEIDVKGGKANLRGIAVLPTPPEAVANNEIIDPVALGKTIRLVLQQSGIKAKKAICSVAGQSSLVVRIIEVPKMTPAELKETMKWEIERHVPFAAEQVVMDYQPLVTPDEVPEGQNMEVLLAVAQESLVTRHVETVQAAGLQPLAIDIEPLAASRSLLDLSNGAAPAGTVAVIDLGASTTDISIYREGRIAFTRSIQLAGNNLTKAISDVLGQPLAEAEELKRTHGGIPEQAFAAAPAEDLFGDQFGGLPTLDFGTTEGDAPVLGGVLGGTFGMGADPGASTATDTQAGDTHSDPAFDIAGGGFTEEAFMSPTDDGGPVPVQQAPDTEGAAPFDLTGGGTPSSLSGPTPAANPFDPGADPAVGAPAPEAAPNPFGGGSLFGAAPTADPFAPLDELGGLGMMGSLGDTATDTGTSTAVPAAMTEEEYLRTQMADAIMPVLHELVTELRRSLDFYRNRANGLGAQQVIITGGTSKLPGLSSFLTANLEVPVVIGNPLQYLSTGPKADPGYLQDVGPVFPVSVGLAVRELLADMTPPRKKKK
jgi:type IV pilus assembly protein PilM